jgi:putative ABC transport system ATP-binding protein
MKPAVRLDNLKKDYVLKNETVHALRGVSFEVPSGDYVAIMGPSGSGKSTLLNVLGCLDKPTSGSLFLGDQDISELNDDELSGIRASHIGFVFQSYNLIPQLNVMENIEVPLHYQGRISADSHKRCQELAELVGLGDRLDHRPQQLSGGQQQRVAIARSLVNDPYFILADEPTGNLDSRTTDEILKLFEDLNQAGKTIILVTHEDEVTARVKRVLRLRDGLLQSDKLNRLKPLSSSDRRGPKQVFDRVQSSGSDSSHLLASRTV